MSNQADPAFTIIGIAVRTTNEHGQSGMDIPDLWQKFMSEGIMEKIPSRTSNDIYCIYTAYEKDHTRPYTTILGCKVENVDHVPEDMVLKHIGSGNYEKILVKGDLSKGIVFEEWTRIWNSDRARTFTADYEVYGAKAQNPQDAEVEIYLAVK